MAGRCGPDAVVVQGDCRLVLDTMANGCVDAVVTDPPWNLGKPYGQHDDAMPHGRYLDWLGQILAACRRVSRTGVVFFVGEHNLPDLDAVLEAAGLRLRALTRWESAPPRPRSEPIAWATGVGSAPPAVADATIRAQDVDPYRDRHPCPKPPLVLSTLLERHVPPDGMVVDPFAGSGSTLQAALDTGRRALGIELEPRYCLLVRERLRESDGTADAGLLR